MKSQLDRKYSWHKEYDPNCIPFVFNANAKVYEDEALVLQMYDQLIHPNTFEKKTQTIARFVKNELIPEWVVAQENAGIEESIASKFDLVLVGRWKLQPYGGLVVRATADKLVLTQRCDMEQARPSSDAYHDPAVWAYDWSDTKHTVMTRFKTLTLGLNGSRLTLAQGICKAFKQDVDYYKTHNP